MTSLLHYDASRYGSSRDSTDTLHMTSGLTRSLKANTLEGVSSECSFFIVLQSDPLFSILSLLPKDQTLKRVIKQLRESPRVAEHFSHNRRTTLSPHDLSSSPRVASAPHKRLVIERPCRVVTQEHSLPKTKERQCPSRSNRKRRLVRRCQATRTRIHHLEGGQERPTSHRPHRIHQNRRCLVRTPLRKRNPLRDHRIKNRRRKIRPKEERRENPQPLPLEERTRNPVRRRNAGAGTNRPPKPRKPSPYPGGTGNHNPKNGRNTRPEPTHGRRRYPTVLHSRVHRPDPNKYGRSAGPSGGQRRSENH